MDERSSLGTVSKRVCFFRNARARNTHVEANLSVPAQALAAPSRGSVAYRPAEPRRPARRASPAATSGRLLLCGVDGAGLFAGGGGAAPYARRHYHLRSAERDGAGVRYGHVVAAETIAVPAAAGDLPAALLGLLAAERRALRDAAAAAVGAALDEKRSAVATLRRKARLAAGDAAERRHRSDDDAAAARFSHLDRDEDDTAGVRGEIDRRARGQTSDISSSIRVIFGRIDGSFRALGRP